MSGRPFVQRAGPTPSPRRQRGRELLELLGLCGLVIAQPVLAVFGAAPDYFVFDGAARADIILFALVVGLAPAFLLWGLVQLVGMGRRAAPADRPTARHRPAGRSTGPAGGHRQGHRPPARPDPGPRPRRRRRLGPPPVAGRPALGRLDGAGLPGRPRPLPLQLTGERPGARRRRRPGRAGRLRLRRPASGGHDRLRRVAPGLGDPRRRHDRRRPVPERGRPGGGRDAGTPTRPRWRTSPTSPSRPC